MAQRYQEIADDLRARIKAGEWQPGDVLPRMQDLAAEYEVARNTVASAIEVLEDERLVWAVAKRGTVVLKPGERRRIRRGNLVKRSNRHVVDGKQVQGGYDFPAAASSDELWEHHITPTATTEPIPEREARQPKPTPGTPVLRRRRVTGPQGESPFQLSDSWIHPDAVAEAPTVAENGAGPGTWLDRLEEAGHGPIDWLEISRARMPAKDEADLLQIPTRIPVIEITRVGYSAKTDRPIEVTVVRIPADRIEFITHLERDASATWPPPNHPA